MILENPVFKHKKIIEKAAKTDMDLFDLAAKKIILNTFRPFKEEAEIQRQKIEIKEDYNMPEWIKCEHRMRRYEEGLGVQSYCLHPFNPLSSKYGLWLVICNKKECNLKKHYDIMED